MLRLFALMLFFLQACDSGFRAIDHRVETLMAEANKSLGDEVLLPQADYWNSPPTTMPTDPFPYTNNPTIDDLSLVGLFV